jgi:hypothetical protein
MNQRLILIPLSIVLLSSLGCGKSQLKEFSPPGGNFTILMPGKPSQETKTINGINMIAFGSGSRGEEHWVGYADVPPGTPTSLDGAVHGMCDASGGTGLKSTMRVNNGEGYVEYEFEATKFSGYISGRALFTRGRLYLFFVLGKNAQLSNPEVRKFIDSFELRDGPTPGKGSADETASDSSETPNCRPSRFVPRTPSPRTNLPAAPRRRPTRARWCSRRRPPSPKRRQRPPKRRRARNRRPAASRFRPRLGLPRAILPSTHRQPRPGRRRVVRCDPN